MSTHSIILVHFTIWVFIMTFGCGLRGEFPLVWRALVQFVDLNDVFRTESVASADQIFVIFVLGFHCDPTVDSKSSFVVMHNGTVVVPAHADVHVSFDVEVVCHATFYVLTMDGEVF